MGLFGAPLRRMRRRMQMIFQDPYASLNPRHDHRLHAGRAVARARLAKGAERTRRVNELIELVGLPEELGRAATRTSSAAASGSAPGSRAPWRVKPEFIAADEAGLRAGRLDPGADHQPARRAAEELGLTYLFIAHDLSVVRHISDRIAVMYLGEVVEQSPSYELYRNPLHPYTSALVSAVPIPDPAIETKRTAPDPGRATSRRRPTRRPAAASTPAAGCAASCRTRSAA